ncbi:CHASE3 domain-containing protein [Spirillospora sp. NPDC029432]|uniref:sensor histidine kinase n=1 Tax=Spirillospora sp. NPDC029432 TaxID=3154599 RepID=UPI003453E354
MTATRTKRGGGLTVQQWLMLVIGLVGLLVVASGAVGYTLLNRTSAAVDRVVNGLSPARTEAYRLQAALVDQETGVRGFVLAGDETFLDPYERGVRAEREAATRLARLVRDEPEAAADLTRLTGLAAAWRAAYAQPVIERVRERGPEAVEGAEVRDGKARFDHVRAAWTEGGRELDRMVAQGRAEVEHDQKVRDAAFAAMLAAMLLAAVLVAIVLHIAVGRPLAALSRSSRQVADGDFEHVITPRGPADLRAVAADVEAMRHRVVRELARSTERAGELERRTAELDSQTEELRRSNSELDAQTEELRRSNSELEQFAYVASHDLQEPLRKVASFCQLLQRRYQDKLDERGNQYIDFAVDGAKRMQVLINDLLTFSRVGRLYDERRPLDLAEPLDKALANLQGTIEEAGARVERPERLPVIDGDMSLLTMLWQNLVGNAVKFRAPDRAPVVRIGCEETAEGWELSVTDNGIGVPPEFADKIFVIFQRLHNREAYTGTGIGLALCKKIVENYGGRIWLDTGDRDEGTGIRFFLPRAVAAEPETPAGADVPEGAEK